MSASSAHRGRKLRVGTALLVFLFFAAFYALFADMEMDGYEVEPYLTAESIWLGNGVTLSTASEIGSAYCARFCEGYRRDDPLTQRHVIGQRILTRTGFTQPLLELPCYGLGLALDRAVFDGRRDLSRRFLNSLFNPLVAALTCCLLFLHAVALFRSERVALAVTMIYGLATAGFAYATIGMETVQTLFLIASLLLIHVARQRYHAGWSVAAGVSVGALLATKASAVIYLPFLVLFFALDLGALPSWRRRAGAMMAFLAPAAVLAVLNLLPTYLLRGGFLEGTEREAFGWSLAQVPIGLYGLLLSAGKSVFLYSPPAILGALALPAFWRQSRREAAALIAMLAGVTLFVAGYDRPLAFADDVWGPRYVISLTPLMILPIGALLRHEVRRATVRVALVALLTAGLLVQVVGVAVCPATVDLLKQHHLESNQNFQFVPHLSDLAINWQVLRSTVHRLSTGRSLPFVYEPLYTGGRDPATPARYVFDLRPHEGFRIWWLSMLTAGHFRGALGQPPPDVAALGAKPALLFAVFDLALLAAVGFALWRRRRET